MWALDVLGLTDDADEREIRRAYARRLKLTRPDEDPQGFQHLHDAYRCALDHARDRVWHDEEVADDPSSESADAGMAATPETTLDLALLPLAESALPGTDVAREEIAALHPSHEEEHTQDDALDLPAFLDDCIAHLSQDDPTALRHWLQSQPALWSLQMKPHIGRWLLQALDERVPAVSHDNFEVVLRFFDLDHVLSGVDAWFLHSLGARLRLRHELQPGYERELGNRVAAGLPLHERFEVVRRAMKQLRRPFSWGGALWFALPYGRASQMRRIAWNLDGGRIDHLGDAIDLQQARFWLEAGDTSRMSLPRRAVAMARCVALIWAIGLVALAVHWLVTDIAAGQRLAESAQAAMLLVGGPVAAYAIWESWIAFRAYLRWQCAPEDVVVRWPALRLFWVPLLAALAMIVQDHDFTVAGTILGLLACATGLLRLGARANLRFSFAGWRLIFVLPFLKGVFGLAAMAAAFPWVSAGLGTTFWLIDALRHTRVLWNAARMRLGRPAADSGT